MENERRQLQTQQGEHSIHLTDEHDDMVEYAIEGIVDASDSPPLKVVDAILCWLEHIRNSRDAKGDELKRIDNIDKAMKVEAQRTFDPIFKAKQIKVFEKFLRFSKEMKSNKPICLPVIETTENNWREEKRKLQQNHNIDFDQISLKQLVQDIDIDTITNKD